MEYDPDILQTEFQGIFVHFPSALALLDEHDRIAFANLKFAALCGGSPQAVCGRQIGELLPLPGLNTLLAASRGQLGTIATHPQSRQARTLQGEFPLSPPSAGGVAMLQVSLTQLFLSQAAEVKQSRAQRTDRRAAPCTRPYRASPLLVQLEDISEKVRWEEQLLQAEKVSGMAELAATMAHELGNPLSTMSSTLQYMQTHLHGDQFHEEITIILDQVDRMHELLCTLADMTGPVEPRVARERVDQLFAQVLTFITQEATRCQVQLKTDFAVGLPCCLVDARQLKQVFLNLCKNALEAMPAGGTLMVRIQPTIGQEQVTIEITDTGVGIPAQALDRIWKPFYSTKAHSTKAGGRGLGLSVCRRVLEQQGGHIHVANPNAGGTTFRLTLPAARAES